MAKKNITKDRPKDLTEYEINRVFEDLHLPEGRRGVSGHGVESPDPSLYFPLTVSTPTTPRIDW
jgi:hypothetical protein